MQFTYRRLQRQFHNYQPDYSLKILGVLTLLTVIGCWQLLHMQIQPRVKAELQQLNDSGLWVVALPKSALSQVSVASRVQHLATGKALALRNPIEVSYSRQTAYVSLAADEQAWQLLARPECYLYGKGIALSDYLRQMFEWKEIQHDQ